MQLRTSGYCFPNCAGIAFVILIVGSIGCSQAAGKPRGTSRSGAPATVAETAEVLDLATLPLIKGAAEPQCRHTACLNYNAAGKVTEVFALVRKQLIDGGWQELPDALVTDQSASAMFTRDGFSLSLSVFPAAMPGTVSIAIMHLGNVALEKLPVPSKAQLLFSGVASVAYLTDMPAEQAIEACRTLLLAKGWEPYGTAGDSLVLKQNAVRLNARVAAAPAQAGKTMISYSAALMSADLPAPADAEGVQFNELTSELMFDTAAEQSKIVDYYRQRLGKTGWEATTDRPVDIDGTKRLILRNPTHDLLGLEMHDFEGKTRVLLKLQSAAEIAELERHWKAESDAKAEAKAKAKAQAKPEADPND